MKFAIAPIRLKSAVHLGGLSPKQLARYQPWFDNARRLKDLVAKLEIASLHAFEQAEAPSQHNKTR